MLCASCGSALPVEARFCPSCGTVVAGAAPGQPPAAPSPNPTPRHERRLLTVMFGDLVGFTNASDGADPEDVRGRVRPFHDLVRREVAKTGGTVARVVGDGVMVVWGYPTAREDDATRAIRAALAIRRGLAGLGSDMHARIGINSGEAVVAFGSTDERADDAMGDAVNVAARLASSAPIDGIVVGESTATLAGSALEAEPMEPLALKGKADLVSAHLVHGLAGAVDPTAAQPFVGRSRELAALRAAFGRAELERGVVRVLITGEPGIGKSRLVAELRREQRDGGKSIWLVGRCREAAGAPVWALGEVVKTWAGIGDDDSPATALAKVDAGLPGDVAERTWVRDRVAQLAGSGTGSAPSADELGLAWAAFLDAVAGDRTAVIQIEDLHWADPELIEVLTGSALATVATPVVLLLTARPEVLHAHPTLSIEGDLLIPLAALPPDDGDELISALATGLDLTPGDRAGIIARCGGNPLFAGELVRLLAQGGRERKADGGRLLPETVQAVIAARLDLLSPETRTVARDAAVIGASFWRGSVDALASIGASDPTSVERALDDLVRLEFIRQRRDSTLPGDQEYAFRHALVRDVAYGQLTRPDRALRHAAAAQWLGTRAGSDRDDLAGTIADHDLRALELAGAAGEVLDTKAVGGHAFRHLIRAGRHAS
ncbi:MAG TPA: AAA family ATPase, partial [Candidatus Limnocylindrales bacterium]|nr:AAA family ATPase [Candidatus Limnocylindrales bacterium]